MPGFLRAVKVGGQNLNEKTSHLRKESDQLVSETLAREQVWSSRYSVDGVTLTIAESKKYFQALLDQGIDDSYKDFRTKVREAVPQLIRSPTENQSDLTGSYDSEVARIEKKKVVSIFDNYRLPLEYTVPWFGLVGGEWASDTHRPFEGPARAFLNSLFVLVDFLYVVFGLLNDMIKFRRIMWSIDMSGNLRMIYISVFYKYMHYALNHHSPYIAFDKATKIISEAISPVLVFILACCSGDLKSILFHNLFEWLSIYVGNNPTVTWCAIVRVLILWILGPLFEEYSRFGYSGMLVIIMEMIPKIVVLFVSCQFHNSFGPYNNQWYKVRNSLIPSLLMHISLFSFNLDFFTRFWIHCIFNISITLYHSGITIDKLLIWAGKGDKHCAFVYGSIFSKMSSTQYSELSLEELVYLFKQNEKDGFINGVRTKEIMRAIEDHDQAQMFSWMKSMFTLPISVGLDSETKDSIDNMVDRLSAFRHVTVDHTLSLGDSTRQTTEALSWIALTYVAVEFIVVKRDSTRQAELPSIYTKLGIVSGILALMKMDDIKKLYAKLFINTGQTTFDPVELLTDGASLFLFGKTYSSTKHSSSRELLEGFAKLGSATTTSVGFAFKVFEWIQNLALYACSCFGLEVRRASGPYADELDRYDILVTEFNTRLNSGNKVTHKELLRLKEVIRRMEIMQKECTRNAVPTVTRHYMAGLLSRYQAVLKQIDRPEVHSGKRDKAPFSVYLCGPPGTGKSDCMAAINKMFVALTVPLSCVDDFKADSSHYQQYTKANTDKYYSGLKNHTSVIHYPDVLQTTDQPGKPESEVNELIHLLSSEVCPANQAELELKGKVFITCDVALLDGNWVGQHREFKSCSEKGAPVRRFNRNAWFHTVVPGFRKSNPACSFKLAITDEDDDGNDAYVSMIDVRKAVDYCKALETNSPSDLWQFRRWCLVEMKPKDDKVYSFSEFMRECEEDFVKYQADSNIISERMAPIHDNLINEVLQRRRAREMIPQSLTFDFGALLAKWFDNICHFDPLNVVEAVTEPSKVEELYGDELAAYNQIKGYETSPVCGMLIDNFASMGPLVLVPEVKHYLDMRHNMFLDRFSGKHAYLHQYSAWRSETLEYLRECGRELSYAYRKKLEDVPDSYWSYEYLKKKFSSFDFFTVRNGVLSLGIIATGLAIYRTCFAHPVPDVKVAQTTSNITQKEKFMNKVMSNQLFMAFEVLDKRSESNTKYTKPLNNVFMLKGRVGVTVGHCMVEPSYYHSQGYIVNLLFYKFSNVERFEPDYKVPFGSLCIVPTEMSDIVCLNFDRGTLPMFPDMLQHFPSKAQKKDLLFNGSEYSIARVVSYEGAGNHEVRSGHGSVIYTEYALARIYTDYFTSESYQPSISTEFMPRGGIVKGYDFFSTSLNETGACGTLGFIVVSDSVSRKRNAKYNQPVPCLLHVAGSAVAVHGCSVWLYHELFDALPCVSNMSLEKFVDSNFEVINNHFESTKVIAASNGLLHEAPPLFSSKDVAHEPGPVGQEFVGLYHKPSVMNRTAIIESAFHGMVDDILPIESELRTSNLGYTKRDEGYVTVVSANSIKYGKNPGGSLSTESNAILLELFVTDLTSKVIGVGPSFKPIILNPINLREAYEGVIKGREGLNGERYSSLPRNRSIGLTLKNTTSVGSRHDIFGRGPFPELGSPQEKLLWDLVQKLHETLLNGGDVPAIYEAMPKDELQSKEKAAVKTRLFSSGDLAMLILNMIYFSDLIASFKRTRLQTGFMPGTNPYDMEEWTSLKDRLIIHGPRLAAKDLKAFDMSVSTLLLENVKTAITNIYSEFYRMNDCDFSRDQLVRGRLLETLTNYFMVYDIGGMSKFVHFNRALCSGTYLTSFVGTFVNAYSHFVSLVSIYLDNKFAGRRLAINSVVPHDLVEAANFVHANTTSAFYGDDSLTGTAYPKLFNMSAMCDHLKLLFGLDATNESEGCATLDEYGYVDLVEASIIGRRFKYNHVNGGYMAPLRFSSIRKSLEFDKKDHTIDIKRTKYDNTLREISMHGPELHDKIVRRLYSVSREKLSYASPYESYMVALASVTDGCHVPVWEEDIEILEAQCSHSFPTIGIKEEFRPCRRREVGPLVRPKTASVVHLPTKPTPQLVASCGSVKGRVCFFLAIIVFGIIIIIQPVVNSIIHYHHVTCISINKFNDFHDQVQLVAIVDMGASTFIPQASSSDAMKGVIGTSVMNSGIDATPECTTEGVTCFEDAAGMLDFKMKGSSVTDVSALNESIREFLSRPYSLTTGSWGTGSASGASLYSFSAVASFLHPSTGVTAWTDKIKGYSMMKGTFVVRFSLNASAFMQGSLILTSIPNFQQFDYVSAATFPSLVQKFMLPHVVMTTKDTVVEFRIPFMGPYGWHYLGSTSDTPVGNVDWGNFQATVLTPLRVGVNATVTNADYQVFAYWEDVELAGPTIPQSSKVKPKRGKIVDGDKIDKPISGALSKISVVSNALSGIPVIGSFASSLSWATGVASGVASAFGYSKPLHTSEPHIVIQAPVKFMATADGPEEALPLALIADNKTEFISDLSSTGEDEMSLNFLYSQIHHKGIYSWTSLSATGSSLYSEYITPSSMYGEVVNFNAGNSTYVYGGPMYYMGNILKYWRGSIKMHIKIIKTDLHTGRLMVVFTPRPHSTMTTTPTIANSVWAIREVIDIRHQDEISLTLPYMVPTDYLNVRPEAVTAGTSDVGISSGYVQIFVLNELRASETVSSQVDLIISYSAGPDFEMQVPVKPQYYTNSTGAQDGSNTFFCAVPFFPQSSDREAVAGVIGNVATGDAVIGPSTRCIGEYLASVKQLLLRTSTGFCSQPVIANSVNSITINPYDMLVCSFAGGVFTPVSSASATTGNGQLWGDMLGYIAPMYEYYKGSLIVDGYSFGQQAMASLVYDTIKYPFIATGEVAPTVSSAVPPLQVPFGPQASSGGQIISMPNAVSFNRSDGGLQSWKVPYSNHIRCSYVASRVSNPLYTHFDPKASLSLTFFSNLNATFKVGRHVADDFQLMHFLACPALLTRL